MNLLKFFALKTYKIVHYVSNMAVLGIETNISYKYASNYANFIT
jgi:hypothetical protein